MLSRLDADGFSPPTPRPGLPFTITALVRNVGTSGSAETQLALYEGSPGEGALRGTLAVPALAPGGGKRLSFQLPPAGLPRPLLFSLVVDSGEAVQEPDERKNVALAQTVVAPAEPADPAVVVSDLAHSRVVPGAPLTAYARIRNPGAERASGTVRFLADDIAFQETDVGLAGQAEALVTAENAGLPPGNVTVEIVGVTPVDANPYNNRATLAVSREPVLVVEIAPPSSPLQVGVQATVRVLVTCREPAQAVRPEVLGSEGVTVVRVDDPRHCAAGDVLSFAVEVTPTARSAALHVRAQGSGGAGTAASLRVSAQAVSALPVAPIALGALVLLGSAAAWTDENLRARLLSLMLPLYHRIRKKEMLDQERRWGIYREIQGSPGVNFGGLKRKLVVQSGVLAHHLVLLEDQRLIVSRRDGIRKRFYPAGAAAETAAPLLEVAGDPRLRGERAGREPERGRVPARALEAGGELPRAGVGGAGVPPRGSRGEEQPVLHS